MEHHPESAGKTNVESEASRQSKTCSDIVADWLSVYAQVYREIVSEELILAYQMALEDLKRLDVLHRAFLLAMKRSKFRPTPEEIISAYEAECDKLPKPKALPPPREDPMTEAEELEYEQAMNKLREK